jgi:pantoate--beta-alanine ligase
MREVRTIRKVEAVIRQVRNRGRTIGLVPTMGYLHEGHLSLVRLAHKHADYVVVSIFVNPAQFGPKEDLTRYPRDPARDRRFLKRAGADLLFRPTVQEMYPRGYRTFVDVADLSGVLCGLSRPGHFRGVATVVLKLFNIVRPDVAVFGRKDFQQTVVIKRMARDLNIGVQIVTGPTVREKSGLAMSSRNDYLTPRQRRDAAVLYQTLRQARVEIRKGATSDPKVLIGKMKKRIAGRGGRVDYVAVVNPDELTPVVKARRGDLVALAVFFGKTRLIDNIVI